MKKVKNLIEELMETTHEDYNYKTISVDGEGVLFVEAFVNEDGKKELFISDETEYGWEYNEEEECWELYDVVWGRDELNEEEIERIKELEYTTHNIKIKY
ncbi:hypothetical protein [Streptobacillus moniliformis]|uniref:hypothetical protein n=1 Tax=Streptobacillus moniliformis TaxID=34105 RepID=UPI0007E33802|nr:hypothetical protein [Streptobacillus moniliformis]